MAVRDPHYLRHGPLAVWVAPIDGCPDLLPLVRSLEGEEPVVWLDSARTHPVTGRWSLLGYRPWLMLSARGDRLELRTSHATHAWRGHPLEALRDVLRRYAPPARSRLGAAGRALGLLGFLSYELNGWIERLPPPRTGGETDGPDMAWAAMRVMAVLDHVEQRAWMVSVADPHAPPSMARRDARDTLEREAARWRQGPAMADAPPRGPLTLQPTTRQHEFERMVSRALEHIRAGDIFQANIAQRFTSSWAPPALPLYERLRCVNPSPFASFISLADTQIVSCSPERLVRVQDGRVNTRPIAGTRPRGATPADDAMNSLDLFVSEKERAEHIMLVDLARNDLGRVARPGSVAVNELMTLEAYSHVMHIVSDVSAALRPGADAVDVIRAVFPGGTITGCPKVRCMELLREIEPVRRGLYTGSVGCLGFDGTMDLNIAIRTMILRGGGLSFHVGAGIVADSDPEREFHETLAKAGALVSALGAAASGGVTHAHTA
jgi:anthranilate/para-aminobenzoate synthase component I